MKFKRISKPGRRIYQKSKMRYKDLKTVMVLWFVSTSQGVLPNDKAFNIGNRWRSHLVAIW